MSPVRSAAVTAMRAAQVDVDIMVKERPMKSADIEAEWQIAPGSNGKPALASIVPGGSLTFEHRNIAKRGRQVRGWHPDSLRPPLRACRIITALHG